MANNISVTEGSGKTVASEDIGGFQYQKVKLVGGETGSTSVLGVTPDGAMKVSVLSGFYSSVSGTIGASVIGTVPVTQAGPLVIAGSVLAYMAPTASLVSA